jgi:hypothetical protein
MVRAHGACHMCGAVQQQARRRHGVRRQYHCRRLRIAASICMAFRNRDLQRDVFANGLANGCCMGMHFVMAL